jgi:hypothetical protein
MHVHELHESLCSLTVIVLSKLLVLPVVDSMHVLLRYSSRRLLQSLISVLLTIYCVSVAIDSVASDATLL